jgi:GDPmannose 4,6-dehydratase
MVVALITGITGQDGFYLANLLRGEGDEVWGLTRRGTLPPDLAFVRSTPPGDVRDQASIERAIKVTAPDEIYHLAAQSSVAESWSDSTHTGEVTGLGTARLLDAVGQIAPKARIFLASSSEIFGLPDSAPQNESTPIRPVSPYGAAKAYSHHLASVYRRHGLYVAAGILYNHESPRRPKSFVTRKITQGAVSIARGDRSELRLGNLEARRDWGFAGDYVRAMRLMLQQPEPGDYVVATGETHSVRDFCETAFARVGLDYQAYVVSDPAYWRPAEPIPLVGDFSRAQNTLGWAPSVSFDELVNLLVAADLEDSDTEPPNRSS